MYRILFCAILFVNCSPLILCNECPGTSWIVFMGRFRLNFKKCLVVHENSVWRCLQNSSLKSFDEVMSCDIIPFTNQIRLVRSITQSPGNINFMKHFDLLVKEYEFNSWQKNVLMKFYKVLSTHILQIDGKGLAVHSGQNEGKGRHRRRNQMWPAMMFGVTALGLVVVPIGFQFLAMLSGKALLMAKLALILASINGLKRIATSGINFGLYQLPDQYNYYDRGDVNQIPYQGH